MNKKFESCCLELAIQYYTSPADDATNTHCILPYKGRNLRLQFLHQTSGLYHSFNEFRIMYMSWCWGRRLYRERASPSPNQALEEFVRRQRREEQKEKQGRMTSSLQKWNKHGLLAPPAPVCAGSSAPDIQIGEQSWIPSC